ncbi:MAG: radical SAM protein [Myxococcota bacterium]|nr:radical SAM protein [Myxococcota bacterium]
MCNNRCVFCVSGQLTELRVAKQLPVEPVLAELEKAAAQGVKKVTFLGGEPTSQKSFLPALKLSVELGYDHIVLFTNGVKARKREWVDKIVAIGKFEWRFSIQGGDEETHDRIVMRDGAFQRILDGMTYLQELGEDLTVNMCVVKGSYESLPHYPELMERFGVRQFHIDMFRPSDAGARTDEYFLEVMPRFIDMAPYIEEMLDRFHAWDPDFDVNIGNYPHCLVPRWAHKVHHGGELTFTVPVNAYNGNNQLAPAFNKYEDKASDKLYAEGCSRCVFQSQCDGIFEKYDEFFGLDEFKPVTMEDLREIDTDQNFFVLQVEEALDPLWREAPPEGWHAKEIFRNTRDRRVEARYLDDADRLVTLLILPPEGVGKAITSSAPVMVTDRYRVSLILTPGVSPDAVGELVAWAQDRLGEAEGITWERRSTAAEVVASIRAPGRAVRAQNRMLRMAQRIQRQGRFGGGIWRYEGSQPLDGVMGTSMYISGPNGWGVDLTLKAQLDEGKSPVGIAYDLRDRTPPEEARPILQELLETLRG